MLDDTKESMADIDLADHAQGLADGDTSEKGEARPDETYPPSPHQLGSYYGRVLFLLTLLPTEYLTKLLSHLTSLVNRRLYGPR